ncbi:hypothetical protein WMR10_002591 [Stenotrophomonas maltophilia]
MIMLPMAQAHCRWTDRQERLPNWGKAGKPLSHPASTTRGEQYRPVFMCSDLTQMTVICVNSA